MELSVTRSSSGGGFTPGILFVDGQFECFTLEDEVHAGPKVPGKTAIPAGRYKVDVTFSQRFQHMLPLVLEVPGFTGIRIHAGNTAADTDGCLLVGQGRAVDSLRDSRLALAALQPKISGALARGQAVFITIRGA